MSAANVYTIPPGAAFVDALAAAVLRECGEDPLRLSAYTILLPTRRAVRSLREAFLRRSGGKALLLPRMSPLGDIDEDALAFADEAAGLGGASLDIPPAMPELRRRLLLAELIRKLPPDAQGNTRGVEQAAHLAAALGRLIDQAATERVGFERLTDLVPERYARHWQITLDFLKLATEHWPRILAAEGAIDAASHRNRLLEAQAALWQAQPPADPVIAAGSTGSIPATADLLAVVASLPNGRLVLPGLDKDLTDGDAWDGIEPSHPQFAMKQLLARIGVERRDVKDWPCGELIATPRARAVLIAEAMRPAGSTDAWRRLGGLPEGALAGWHRIDCPSPREEAGVIALLMREALEVPGRTAALVTPDRALARRVAVELERWDIAVDDSAGASLDGTTPGIFLRLLAIAAAEDLAPLPLVALLKHPLAAGGLDPASFRQQARLLELALLRGPRPSGGIAGLRAALKHIDKRHEQHGPEIARLIDRLDRALGLLVRLLRGAHIDLAQILETHLAAAEALAASDKDKGIDRLWHGEAGERAAAFMAELIEAARDCAPIEGAAYPGWLATLLADPVVRPRYGRHPRLFIWGPLEARLQHADLLILGGLNEGTWPPAPPVDPWMSRPMRKDFGLPEPERRIGLSAHDFAQACAAPEVVLTRAIKVEGTPTVPARWLLRLDNLLRAVGLRPDREAPQRWLAWQGHLDAPPGPPTPISRPAPRPPVAARPRRLTVTEIETWMRDPYGIYARRILKLRALDPLDADPGAAERGSFIHEALARFLEQYPKAMPPDAVRALLEIGERAFGAALERPGMRAFWWPRFVRIADWFVEGERERRKALLESHGEVSGVLALKPPGGDFILEGRADRIDRLHSGGLAIVDYKTGAVPSDKTVAAGFAPQLPLEAAMAREGAFRGIPAAAVEELAFWKLSGGDPAGMEAPIKGDIEALARQALEGLRRLIETFDDPATPYLARPRPGQAPRFSDYAHLARVKEWSAGGDEE